ncbi:MAG: hypothetical protein JG761_1388, partial [Proteiniphilum sp.]|nr:hypothetical protein [Proteiniphilum sp.]MDK2852744.1 hypothetical protein [Proteiniphilum sp.]
MINAKNPRDDSRGLVVVKDGGYLLSHFVCSTIGAIGLN